MDEFTGPAQIAESTAKANVHLGGGGRQVFVDVDDLVSSGVLKPVDGPATRLDLTDTRAAIEDPRYSAVRPDLPLRSLDPRHEAVVGGAQGAGAGAGVVVGAHAERSGR